MRCRKSAEPCIIHECRLRVPRQCTSTLAHQVRSRRKRKIPERDLAAARYMEISAPSCVNSDRSHTYPHRDPARDILSSGNSPPLRSVYISFTVSYSIVAVADDRTRRSRKTLLAVSFSTGFRHMISHVKSPTDHISRTFLIHGSIHTMHLPYGHTLPSKRSLRGGSRRYPLFRGSPSPYRQRCRLLSSHL